MQIPLFLGAISIFYNNEGGTVPSGLKLDACLLAGIFSGQITDWNHADITKANPGKVPSGKIVVVHRVKGSSSTSGTTSYLDTGSKSIPGCKYVWPSSLNGGKNVGSTVGTNGVWIGANSGEIAAQGSSGVAS